MSSPPLVQPQTPDARKVGSDGEDFSDTVNEITNFEYSDANKTATSSSHQDSEYDTASDSQSSDEADLRNRRDSGSILDNDDEIPTNRARELSCNDTVDADGDAGDDEYVGSDDDSESGSIMLDLERQRGDGEEEHDEESKKVDDDEDRSNPQYIPKRGVFYEHDDRTADDVEAKDNENEEPAEVKKPLKKTSDRWAHDFYDESEQAPKSRSELVNSYGYDIRNEDGPPKTRRNRRYNRGPSKYTRKWEDESAYSKPNVPPVNRNPRPEDFPELGSKGDRRSKSSQLDREEKENKLRQNEQRDDERSYSGNHSSNRHISNRQTERSDGPRRRQPQHTGYSSSNRSGRESHSDDRRMSRDKNYRPGRNTMNSIVIKNQNRNKNNDNYDGRGSHHRNNSGSNLDKRNLGDDEHVESISFTNSKLNNSGNRYSNVDYPNVGSPLQERDYADSQATNQQRPITGRQQMQNQPVMVQQQQSGGQQSQQSQQQRFQLVSNDMPINLEAGNQIANQQNPQNPLLAINHSMPITTSGPATMNQQTLHNQGLGQVQQQEMVGGNANNMKGHGTKRYSNQRNRTNIETQPQPQPQPQAQAPSQQLPINVVQQPQTAQATVPQPQQGVVPNVTAPGQYQPNYFANEYPAIAPTQTQAQYGQPAFIGFASDISQQPSGSAYIQQGAPPQAPSVSVVPQMMNFVPAHPPIQAPPVVQPVPNAQNQYPSYPYAGVQNYNTPSGITYYAPQTQPPPRPILSQRRPTNAIPIMAPPERSGKHRSGGQNTNNDGSHRYADEGAAGDQQQSQQPENEAENIDHILDNMFTQRPHPYPSATGLAETTTRKSLTPPIEVQKSHSADALDSQDKSNIEIVSAKSLQKDENEQQAASSLVAM